MTFDLACIFKVIRPWLAKTPMKHDPSCPLCTVYSSGWIISIFGIRGCQLEWPLTLTYIFKIIWPCLCNKTRRNMANLVMPALQPVQFWIESFHAWYKWSLTWEGLLHIMTIDLDLYLQCHFQNHHLAAMLDFLLAHCYFILVLNINFKLK